MTVYPALEEATDFQVAAAVACLPVDDIRELAKGPIVDPNDTERCRFCEWFDDYAYGYGPATDHHDAVVLLLSWHRWWGDPDTRAGRGAEASRRCQVIYGLAKEFLEAQEAAGADWVAVVYVPFDKVTWIQVKARADAIAAAHGGTVGWIAPNHKEPT